MRENLPNLFMTTTLSLQSGEQFTERPSQSNPGLYTSRKGVVCLGQMDKRQRPQVSNVYYWQIWVFV